MRRLAAAVLAAAFASGIGARALAEEAPPPPDDSVRFVPESWREKARLLLDAGDKGLPGGFVLRGLDLGEGMSALYAGPKGEVVVWVASPKTLPKGAFWSGKRLAIGVSRSTAPEPDTTAALRGLVRLLEEREGAWGWLERPRESVANEEAARAAREVVRGARRDAWTGRSEKALAAVVDAVARVPGDLPTLLDASRVAWRIGRASEAKDAGSRAAATAESAAFSAETGGDLRRGSELRLAAASAAALAGDPPKAESLARAVVDRGLLACETRRVAVDLARAGDLETAARVADAVMAKAAGCDEAWAVRIDVARLAGRIEDGRDVVRRGLETFPASLAIRVAEARLELAAGRPEAALEPARVAVQRGTLRFESVPVLAAVVAASTPADAVLEEWDGLAARWLEDADSQVLGALACLARGDPACAANRFAAGRAKGAADAEGIAALEALALAGAGRPDDAERRLTAAWNEDTVGPWTVAAEAATLEARGEQEAAIATWRAYLDGLALGPGPVSAADARARIARLEGREVGTDAAPAEPSATGGEPGGVPAAPPAASPEDPMPPAPSVWIWAVLAGVFVALYLWLRRRN